MGHGPSPKCQVIMNTHYAVMRIAIGARVQLQGADAYGYAVLSASTVGRYCSSAVKPCEA
eukprot:5923117-Prymnesium_polylepis.2